MDCHKIGGEQGVVGNGGQLLVRFALDAIRAVAYTVTFAEENSALR